VTCLECGHETTVSVAEGLREFVLKLNWDLVAQQYAWLSQHDTDESHGLQRLLDVLRLQHDGARRLTSGVPDNEIVYGIRKEQ
jgi:hypothetical protein